MLMLVMTGRPLMAANRIAVESILCPGPTILTICAGFPASRFW